MQDYQVLPGNGGIKVLYDVPDLECGTVKNVVLRNGITEPLWNRVMEMCEPPSQQNFKANVKNDTALEQQHVTVTSGEPNDDEYETTRNEDEQEYVVAPSHQHRVCVVGSNGVGKTTTTAVLIRSLLLQGKSVVYHIRTADKSRWVYEFIPTTKDAEYNRYNVEVKVIPEIKFNVALTPTLVDNIQNYYIVDSGSTYDSNCNPDDQVQCRVVLVTSPDERQWGGGNFTVLRGGKTSGTFLYYPSWTLSELQMSYSLMIPSTNDFLTLDVVTDRYNEVGGIPGHLVAPSSTYRDIITVQSDNVATLTKHQLQLIARNYWKHIGSISTIVGYTQQKKESDIFSNAIVRPVSWKAFESICSVHGNFLWNQFQRTVVVDVPFANKILGVWCKNVMIAGSSYLTKYRDAMNDSNTVSTISLGGCDRAEICETDIITAASETENVLFYSQSQSSSVADFAYRRDGVYNLFICTVEGRRQLNLNCFQEIRQSARSEESHVHLYYVVPSFNFESFTVTTKPDRPSEDAQRRNKISVFCFSDERDMSKRNQEL